MFNIQLENSNISVAIENDTIIYIEIQKEWKDYIYALKNLPELIAFKYNFKPGTPDEKSVYRWTIQLYTTLSEWMNYFVPGTNPTNPELFSTDKANIKARAELSKAVLNLMTELLPRSAELQEKYNTPADIWYDWEFQLLDNFFWNSGLLIGKPDIHPNKKQMAKANRDIANNLEDARLDWSKATVQEVRLNAAIYLIADNTARNDETFRHSDAFQNYMKQIRRWGNTVASPKFNCLYLSNGNLLPTGRNTPRNVRPIVTKMLPKKS